MVVGDGVVGRLFTTGEVLYNLEMSMTVKHVFFMIQLQISHESDLIVTSMGLLRL